MKIKRWQILLIILLIIIFSAICIYAGIQIFSDNNKQVANNDNNYNNGWSKNIVAEIIDGDVPIPNGFEYVSGDRDTGLIIRDKKTNAQYIWIPIKYSSENSEEIGFTIEEIFGDGLTTLSPELIKNIEKYGGIYVGITDNANYKIPNFAEMTEEELKQAKLNIANLYGESSVVTSRLMTTDFLKELKVGSTTYISEKLEIYKLDNGKYVSSNEKIPLNKGNYGTKKLKIEEIKYDSEGNSYVKVSYNNSGKTTTAIVKGSDIGVPNKSQVNSSTNKWEDVNQKVYLTSEKIEIKSSYTGGQVLGTLKKGESFTIKGKGKSGTDTNGWLKIDLGGKTGYIYGAKYTETSEKTTTILQKINTYKLEDGKFIETNTEVDPSTVKDKKVTIVELYHDSGYAKISYELTDGDIRIYTYVKYSDIVTTSTPNNSSKPSTSSNSSTSNNSSKPNTQGKPVQNTENNATSQENKEKTNFEKIKEDTLKINSTAIILKDDDKDTKLASVENTFGDQIATVLKDVNGDLIPIPKGFKYYSGETAKSGIKVVYESSKENDPEGKLDAEYRLAYVWVPVNKNYTASSIENAKSELKVIYDKEGKKTDYYDNLSEDLPPALRASIKKYGGFYISEAELGFDDNGNLYNRWRDMKTVENGWKFSKIGDYLRTKDITKYQSIKKYPTWLPGFETGDKKLTYSNAVTICESLFKTQLSEKEGSSVVSHLTYGSEWDAVVVWLLKSNAASNAVLSKYGEKDADNEKVILGDSSKIGKYSSETGVSDMGTALNGIWGLAGNLGELTQERYYNNGKYEIVTRGGGYNKTGSELPLAGREYLLYGRDNVIEEDSYGLRNCLYIKVTEDEINSLGLEKDKIYTVLKQISCYESAVDAVDRKNSKLTLPANIKISMQLQSGKAYGFGILGTDKIYYLNEDDIILRRNNKT